MTTIAILGGGFCGTMAAVHLARLGGGRVRPVLVNAEQPTGRGVAYGTPRPEHVLNVLAKNMSALPDEPAHFTNYLRSRPEYAGRTAAELGDIFAQRRIYGDYVEGLLRSHPEIVIVDGEAVDVEPGEVLLANGRRVAANVVVLATGNLAPLEVPGSEAVRDHPAYMRNPWDDWQSKLPGADGHILMIGTSLTMVDAVLTLQELGWKGRVTAVSRNGLLPMSHFPPQRDAGLHFAEPWTWGLAKTAVWVETNCERLRREGLNPAAVVDKLRPVTQRVWQSFTPAEKREFNNRYRTRWGVARHRIAPEVAARVNAAIADGMLRVLAGEIRELRADGKNIRATIGNETINAGLVMNCTGPRERFSDAPEPLYRNLFRRGLVKADEVDLGLQVTPDFAAIQADGTPSKNLYAFGPLIRGTLWETTAVPELREQAQQVAQAILR